MADAIPALVGAFTSSAIPPTQGAWSGGNGCTARHEEVQLTDPINARVYGSFRTKLHPSIAMYIAYITYIVYSEG